MTHRTRSNNKKKTNRYRRLHRRSVKIATVGGFIHYGARLLRAAGVCCASGMQEPFLEAEYLVCHGLS
ncbi:MAG: hypothetical protein HQL60_01380, partial [Magnetococcales bacterium]|nr:hypothetical protein [Magnetococcales bacterium]